MTKRYRVEYSHKNCHPETCCHNGDYRIYDNVEHHYFYYHDDEKYLQDLCDQWNKEEEFNEQI